jgi:hypothetical protein
MAMETVQSTALRALAMMIEAQPTSAAKVAFAWRIAAGPALGRATKVAWTGCGTLHVRAATPAWQQEARRARPIIRQRLDQLLGANVVGNIEIEDF